VKIRAGRTGGPDVIREIVVERRERRWRERLVDHPSLDTADVDELDPYVAYVSRFRRATR
jgi:hypothetical protein